MVATRQSTLLGRQRKHFRRYSKALRRRSSSVAPAVLFGPSTVRDLQYFDTGIAQTTDTAIQYGIVFIPTQGSTATSRYGDKTIIKSIKLQFLVKAGGSQTGPVNTRILLLWDNQPNGALPGTPLPLTSTSVVAFTNPDYRHRFKVLRDWLIPSAPQNSGNRLASNDLHMDQVQRVIIKNCSLPSVYFGNAGGIADISTGALIFMSVSDVALTSGNTPVISGNIRCLFKS